MKHLLLAVLLLASFSSAFADTPAKIAEDYRKQAAVALIKLNETLEKATTPLIAKLVASGDTAGADTLAEQLKAKLAGEPAATPHASATLLFAQYDQARAKALEPVQKASIARIETLLKSTSGTLKLETITELSKVRAEIEARPPAAAADAAATTTASAMPKTSTDEPKSNAAASKSVAELVKSLGGKYNNDGQGDDIVLPKSALTTADLLQFAAAKRLKSFIWSGGSGLTDEGMAAFAGMTNLNTLYLWDSGRLTDAGLKHLSGCSKLEVLNIGATGDGVTGSGLENLSQCKSLRKLNLGYLSKIQGANLSFLKQLKSFETLLLSHCKNISDADLELIGQLTQLKSLELTSTSVTDAGLAKLTGLRHLEELIVSAPLVTSEGTEVLKKARPALVVKFVK